MRDWGLYADDILNACRNITRYREGHTLESFITDTRTRDAITHNLMIIGEAVKKIPPDILKEYTEADWRKIAGLRDIISHAYFQLKPGILWNIIVTKIDPLQDAVIRILEEKK